MLHVDDSEDGKTNGKMFTFAKSIFLVLPQFS